MMDRDVLVATAMLAAQDIEVNVKGVPEDRDLPVRLSFITFTYHQ